MYIHIYLYTMFHVEHFSNLAGPKAAVCAVGPSGKNVLQSSSSAGLDAAFSASPAHAFFFVRAG